MKWISVLCLALSVGVAAGARAAEPLTIVYGSRDGWIAQHAAEELAKYYREMTGEEVAVVADGEAWGAGRGAWSVKRGALVLIGGPDENRVTRDLEERRLVQIKEKLPEAEGAFVIQSARTGYPTSDIGHPTSVIVFAGGGPGVLYAVYHYLENFCDVGFYRDGDYVPKRPSIPVAGIDVVEKPRFKYRMANFSMGYRSLGKFEPMFWTLDQWKQQLDYMAKRKLNLTGWPMYWWLEWAGTVPYEVFHEMGKPKPGSLYQAGFPAGWGWPPEYRTWLGREILSYGRRLGIKFFYGFDWGNVPGEFLAAHPEIKSLPKRQSALNRISPDDPQIVPVMKRYMEAFNRTFGTDQMYLCTPYAEEGVGQNVEDTIRLKVKAAIQFYDTIHSLSPDAIWMTDSWDFDGYWTPEAIAKYFEELPKDLNMLMYDTNADYLTPPKYKRYNYFYGRDWAFAVLHAFGGDDSLFGNIDNIIQRLKEVAHDPKANHCVGVFMTPELCMENILFYEVVAQLAWNPDSVTKARFLRNYARQRYGVAAEPLRPPEGAGVAAPAPPEPQRREMLRGVEALVDAAYENPLMKFWGVSMPESEYDKSGYYLYNDQNPIANNPYYQFPYLGFGNTEAFPVNSDQDRCLPQHKAYFEKTIPKLKKAGDLYLAARDVCAGNPLYENDLVDIFRTYTGLVFNLELIEAYEAFKAGDTTAFQIHARDARMAMEAVEKVLSTRPDFSLAKMIDDAMQVPGSNPYLPEMIKQGNIVAFYPSRDCYELMALVYRPRIEVYLSELEQRLKAGIHTISFQQVVSAWNDEFRLPGFNYATDQLVTDRAHSPSHSLHNISISLRGKLPPAGDIGVSLFVLPVKQSGNGDLTCRVRLFDDLNRPLAVVTYVLMGEEDYWGYQNTKAGDTYYATSILNYPCLVGRPPVGRRENGGAQVPALHHPGEEWVPFRAESARKTLDDQFGQGTWDSLGASRFEVAISPWAAGGEIDGYVDDLKIDVGGPEPQSYSTDFESAEDGVRLEKFLHEDVHLPPERRYGGTTQDAILRYWR